MGRGDYYAELTREELYAQSRMQIFASIGSSFDANQQSVFQLLADQGFWLHGAKPLLAHGVQVRKPSFHNIYRKPKAHRCPWSLGY